MEIFIPKGYKEKLIIHKIIWFQNKWITFALTKDNCILEFDESKNLQNFYKLSAPPLSNDSHFKIVSTIREELLLILKVCDQLIVIKRTSPSLELIFHERRIGKFRLRSNKNVIEDNRWLLYFTTVSGKVKKTNLCELCKPSGIMDYDSPIIQKYLHEERIMRRFRLDVVQKKRLIKLCRLVEAHKFIPKIARISTDFDVSPLVRFGSMLKLTNNVRI